MSVLDNLFARYYDTLVAGLERKGMAQRRAELLGGISGDVLEIGAGTGANLEVYPATVTSLTLTEPLAPMAQRLREHVERARPGTTVIEAPAERLPFADQNFDVVVSTLVLCSVDDPAAAVAEMHRVLRPGGQAVIVEHVGAQGRARIAQRIWEPAQKVLGRNCHMTRDTRAALDAGGFDTSSVVDTDMPGAPSAMFPAISGIAVRA